MAPLRVSRGLGLGALLALAACVGPTRQGPTPRPAPTPPPARPQIAVPVPPAPTPANAVAAGLKPGPAFASLPTGQRPLSAALTAFRLSCPALVRRSDPSGLTRPADWQPACDASVSWPDTDAQAFFARYFETAQVGDGRLFATGYYEPEIAGSRVAAPGFAVPIYRNPGDIIEVDLGLWSQELKGRRVRGRIERNRLVPYYERGQIEDGVLAGRGLELAWAADPVELFFLEIQGSGRLRLPDGSVMRLGFDGQNGRDYVGIGRLMRDRGLLGPGETNMQGIMAWLRAHPDEGRAIMRENKSYVFFRELTGAGPIGAMGVAVTGGSSVAADPGFVPLGAPILLDADRPEASGLWIAQDTGGAIKGANRVDTFWGAGADARTIAGGMSARGQAWLLLPIGTLARLGSGNGAAPPRP
ncbi:murein transglycosylase A [Sphingomonas sp. XMGL2]|uniref:peptidoglycan lytic exotransglycosylase n=1 Tax=Sphingomonas quercus TaxID=2842451 RepID=A0ABS6BLA2_9SPHN|nr:murein transglycosylase A [Sphingomonas quercus]